MARARGSGSVAGVPPMVIVEIDGSPYVDAEWLEHRINRDRSRVQRWRQEAERFAKKTDPDGIVTRAAYLWQSLAMSYRVEKWQRCLALTQSALANRQRTARVEFGLLLKDRRLAADMTLRELASRADVDHKTVLNIETASFLPSRRSLERIVAVRELFLTWADVSSALLDANLADGRKHRKPRRKNRRMRRSRPSH